MSLFYSAGLGGTAIPDSVIHRWQFDGGSGSAAADSEGSADGSINGATWSSGTWIGDYALSFDGTDDYVDTTQLGAFGSSMDTDFAIIFTVQTTNTSYHLFNVTNSSDSTELNISHNYYSADAVAGEMTFWVRDAGGDRIRIYTTDANIDDGNKHRVVCQKTSNSASGLEVYVDATQASTTTKSDQAFDNPSDFDVNFPIGAENYGGSIDSYADATLDEPMISNDSLTSTEIQDDYNRQPWS